MDAQVDTRHDDETTSTETQQRQHDNNGHEVEQREEVADREEQTGAYVAKSLVAHLVRDHSENFTRRRLVY